VISAPSGEVVAQVNGILDAGDVKSMRVSSRRP